MLEADRWRGLIVLARPALRADRLCRVPGIETPLNVQLPAVIEPTLFDISPN
jgi:hypothetical protein